MGSNSNLTLDLAQKLIRGETVICPKCRETALTSRYKRKKESVEFKCVACGEIYHPCKLL